MSFRVAVVCALSLAAAAAPPRSADASIMRGQVDTFETGSSMNWGGGQGPTVIEHGGPLGADDKYLKQTADGSGSGGKLSMYNHEQWLGDYLAAGVTGIEMDLLNIASQALTIRIAFKTSGGQTSPGFAYANGFSLPNDGRWHHAVFGLTAAEFTAVRSPGTFADTLSTNAVEFRILHATTPILTGTPITGSLGIDNIHAIPGPSTAALLGLVGLGVRRRRR